MKKAYAEICASMSLGRPSKNDSLITKIVRPIVGLTIVSLPFIGIAAAREYRIHEDLLDRIVKMEGIQPLNCETVEENRVKWERIYRKVGVPYNPDTTNPRKDLPTPLLRKYINFKS